MKQIIIRKKRKNTSEVAADLEMIEKLAGYGLTDESIANVLGVTPHQIWLAKNTHRALAEALKAGRDKADKNVIETLYRKAIGYEKKEIQYFKLKDFVNGVTVTKYYQPDLSAIIFWLKNRRPEEWKEIIESSSSNINEKDLKQLFKLSAERMKECI
ncbi:MAG: hypothetical protein EHM58_03275 [Ignavibacteriae bacterium]|nr:MAG: hypothetical protein EHM58_03275 [Ignavibacteriota bacterium]